MAFPPPKIVGHCAEQMKLVCYAPLPENQHSVAGVSTAGPGPRKTAGLAVCEYEKGEYYLFTCDDKWNVMFDTNHQDVEEAMRQAEFEYPGINSQWVHSKTRGYKQ